MNPTLHAPFLQEITLSSPAEKVSQLLNQQTKHILAYAPWPKFNYKPEVSFTLAHGKDVIFLKFFIREEAIRAIHLNPNDPVYEDSCVEFFIGFNNEPDYYNFEFNFAGTCLLGYGSDRDRKLHPAHHIKKIRHHSLIRNPEDELIYWEITLVIPAEVLIYHHITDLSKISSRVNFFKCGDGLPRAHYLCWNNIESRELNFHQSKFFGQADFG